MRVLIAADMEGIAGIDDHRVCSPAYWPSYNAGCQLMTDEVLVALGALRDAGADEIVVGDWHMVGTNIIRERLPSDVDVHPIADFALTDLAPSFTAAAHGKVDGIVMLGHHASQNNRNGFCSHTFAWGMEIHLDGEPLSEAQIYAQAAAEEIPILLLAGDSWLIEDLGDDELPGTELVATKTGLGRDRAQSEPLEQVEESLARAIERAVAANISPPPLRKYPAELSVTLAGAQLLREQVADPLEMLKGISIAFKEGKLGKEYRMLARLFPAGDAKSGSPVRRRLGAILAAKKIKEAEIPWLSDAGLVPVQ